MSIKKKKIPLHTALWANVYEALKRHKVKFPKGFSGIVACYAGLVAIDEILKEYKIKNK